MKAVKSGHYSIRKARMSRTLAGDQGRAFNACIVDTSLATSSLSVV